jgi:hypothetical protein
MCYSAQILASYKRYVREWGADVSIKQFFRLYWLRSQGAKIKIPKAMDAAFSEPDTDEERQIAEMISAHNAEQALKLEQELFKQRKRLADAERTLQTKTTKTAQESKRIATDKVEWCLGKLNDLRRTELNDEDHRIFPGWYAPVLAMKQGQRILVPMRYQCRPVAATVAFSAPRRISMGSGDLPATPFTIICRVRRAAISGASMATFCISFPSLDRDRMDALFMLAAPIQ